LSAITAGIYLERDTLIHRLDPRAKLIWLITVFSLSILFQWNGLYSIPVYISVLLILAASGITVRRALAVVGYNALLFLVAFLVWASLYSNRGELLFVFPIGGVRITDVGLRVGLGKFVLIVAPITAVLVFLSTTRVYDMIQMTQKMGLSVKVGYVFALALSLLPMVIQEAKNIMDIQKMRGVPVDSPNIFTRIRATVSIFVPLIIRLMSTLYIYSAVLTVRGFGLSSKRTYLFELRWRRRDSVFTLAVVTAAAVYAYVCIALQPFGPIWV